MKLTVQKVMDATLTISAIIREARPMPQKGKYRLARMHAKLLPEFTIINEKRDELIKAYDYHPMVEGPGGPLDTQVKSENFAVPTDKMEEFGKARKEIADEEIELDVEPMPLAQLDLGDNADGSIEASELIVLGELVRD